MTQPTRILPARRATALAAAAVAAAFSTFALALGAGPASAQSATGEGATGSATMADSPVAGGGDPEFGARVRAYLLQNPEVIAEALQVLQDRREAERSRNDLDLVTAHHAQLFEDDWSWVGGNPDGDVTLVEFLDYRCGFCRRAHPEIAKLLAEDDGVRLVVKEFPILGEASLESSRFAVATKLLLGDEAYEGVHNTLIELEGEPTELALTRIAEGLGFDPAPVFEHMESDAVAEILSANRELAVALGISGTPSFALEGGIVRGFVPAEDLAALVARQR